MKKYFAKIVFNSSGIDEVYGCAEGNSADEVVAKVCAEAKSLGVSPSDEWELDSEYGTKTVDCLVFDGIGIYISKKGFDDIDKAIYESAE